MDSMRSAGPTGLLPLNQAFLDQLQHNCQIANARQVGLYSLCGMLLRLRQLYKWQHGLDPWQEPDPPAVLEWIARQEDHWGQLEETPLGLLPLADGSRDPFAVAELNSWLAPHGLAYGAGYGHGLAPTFFMADLAATRQQDQLTILVLGTERHRDLNSAPAMRQENLIYARQQTLAYNLWEHLADPTYQNNPFLHLGLSGYGLKWRRLLADPGGCRDALAHLAANELEAIIHHEIGEARETSLDAVWSVALEAFANTRIERWVRALKDALADLNEAGRLQYLIARENLSSLALMLTWRPGFYPLLLPELEPACNRLVADRHWDRLDQVRLAMLGRLRQTAAELTELLAQYRDEPARARPEIERRFLAPLGL